MQSAQPRSFRFLLSALSLSAASAAHSVVTVLVSEPTAPPLTRAERQVLVLLLVGCQNAAIAAARGTSTRTIANQVTGLFRKFATNSRNELAARVVSLARRGALPSETATTALALSRLKPRQRLALEMRARGYSVKHIAYELGIACSTVSLSLKEARRVLGIRSCLELCTLLAEPRPDHCVTKEAVNC